MCDPDTANLLFSLDPTMLLIVFLRYLFTVCSFSTLILSVGSFDL